MGDTNSNELLSAAMDGGSEKKAAESLVVTKGQDQGIRHQKPSIDNDDINKEWDLLRSKCKEMKWFRKAELGKIEDCKSLLEAVNDVKRSRYKRGDNSTSGTRKIEDRLICLLNLYKPVFEILKETNPNGVPAGAVVYGCLFVLVKIAESQRQLEAMIEDTLEIIEQWFRLLNEYRELYKEDTHLQGYVKEMYGAVFEFVLEVFKYSCRGRGYRLLFHMTAAVNGPINEASRAIDTAGRRILSEATSLLHRRIFELRSQSKEFETKWDQSQEENEKYREEIKQNHAAIKSYQDESKAWQRQQEADQSTRERQEWRNKIREIQLNLGSPEKVCIKERLDHLRQWERDWEHSIGPDSENIQHGNIDTLTSNSAFRRFNNSPRPALMLILALNHANANTQPELWLSSALVDFALHLEPQHTKVIYHVVHSRYNDPSKFASSLISEVLGWDLNFFKDHQHLVRKALRDDSPPEQDLEYKLDLIRELLSAWASRNEDFKVYFILDRVDRGLHHTRLSRTDRSDCYCFREYLRGMLDMMEKVKGGIKVLLLADQSSWPRSPDLDWWRAGHSKSTFVIESDWQQGLDERV